MESYGWKETLQILIGICNALVYLHSQKPVVLHLDLKPHNVMIDEHGNAKLADLGESHVVSRHHTRSTFSPHGIGTPNYMAPEMQDAAEEKSDKSDMFSFGVMMAEVGGGREPNPGPAIHARRIVPERERRADDIAAAVSRFPSFGPLIDNLMLDETRPRWNATRLLTELLALFHSSSSSFSSSSFS
jgi:serine/threonine protein kinase